MFIVQQPKYSNWLIKDTQEDKFRENTGNIVGKMISPDVHVYIFVKACSVW
jgi:hypothetical protein